MSAAVYISAVRLISVQQAMPAITCTQDDANIRWFVLRDGEMAYDPFTNNYLAIRRVSQEQIDTLLAIADKQPDPFKLE